MPFLLFLILAGLISSSAALRTECVGLMEDLWDFGNRWLRLIIGMALSPLLMVVVAGIGLRGTFVVEPWIVTGGRLLGALALLVAVIFLFAAMGARRWVVPICCLGVAAISFTMASIPGEQFALFNGPAIALVLGFVPTIAVVVALSQQPMLVAVPSIVNAVESGLEQVIGSVPLPKRFRPSVKLPRVFDMKQILWPLAAFAVTSLLLGIYLYEVPVWNSVMLLLVLLALGLAIAWLSVFDKWKKLQGMLQFVAVILTLIICLGGKTKAGETISGQWEKLFKTFSYGSDISGYNSKAICSDSDVGAAADLPDLPHESGPDTVSAAQFNDPLGLKFSSAVEKLGAANGITVKDSGVRVSDGGTWAQFATPDDGIRMAGLVLTDLKDARGDYVYGDSDLNAALRTWSDCKDHPGHCYGGEILAGSGLNVNRTPRELSAAELNQLVALMRPHETPDGATGRPAVAIEKSLSGSLGKNDHLKDRIRLFKVPLKEGCFGDGGSVRVPSFWNTWNIDFEKPNDQSLWFAPWFWPEKEPRGAYHRWNMPDFFQPPLGHDGRHADWLLQGRGILVYRQTS